MSSVERRGGGAGVLRAALAALATMSLAAAGWAASPPVASGAGAHGVRASTVCPAAANTYYRPGHELYMHCDALVLQGTTHDAPTGYGPPDLQSAYDLTKASANRGKGQTVAIIDAYDDPNAESDLATYRDYYGLPACTTKNGCFEKVNQEGQASPLPPGDSNWALEISLDVDMVSAICPNCHILLVEANTASTTDLFTAEDEAAALGAQVLSNSWGSSSDAPDSEYGQYLDLPGHAITISGGDRGYGVHYPATSRYVTAVEGTTLVRSGKPGRGWTETVWGSSSGGSGTGSGCSIYNDRPKWQAKAWVDDTACLMRTMGDVAADANPGTGAAVYDTYQRDGWATVGGDSEASPIVAAVYALAGNAPRVKFGSYPYRHHGHLYDIKHGTNGMCTPPHKDRYFCTARTGYDGPSGLGTPRGYRAF